MKRVLSVGALVQHNVPKATLGTVTASQLAGNPGAYSLSRRKALGLAGVLSVTAAPMASAIEHAVSATFAIERRGRRIVFLVAGKERWVIDPKAFDGDVSIISQSADGEISVEMTGAYYPGTTIPADFTARITRGVKPTITIELLKLGARFSTDFIPWLLERTIPEAPINTPRPFVCGDATVNVSKGAMVQFRPSWMLTVHGSIHCSAPSPEGTADRDGARLDVRFSDQPSSMLVPASRKGTVVRVHRGQHLWDVPLRIVPTNVWDILAYGDAFDTLTMECSADARQAFLYTGATDARSFLRLAATDTRLGLRNVRFGYGITEQGIHRALVADYATTPVWMVIGGVSLELGNREGIQPLQLECVGEKITKCIVAPGLLRYTIPIDGAISQPTRTAHGVQLALLPKNIPPSALPKPSYTLASLQLDKMAPSTIQIGGQAPLQGQPKFKITKNVDKVGKFGPLFDLTLAGNPTVTVIRPDDLLVLTFEFAGLTINKSAGTFSGSGKLIVHFQPQHIAERAFFYVNDPDKPANDPSLPNSAPKNSGANEPRIEPPIDSVLAGSSRLVFQTPNGFSGQYSIEGLLDWSKLTPKVSPSALPPDVNYALSKLGSAFITKYVANGTTVDPKPGVMKVQLKGGGNQAPAQQKYTMAPNMASQVSANNANLKTTFESSADFSKVFSTSFASAYAAELLAKPPIKIPEKDETVIEYPYRLFLSPNKYSGWSHAKKPKTDESNGRTELWHTRLGVKWPDGTVNEEAAYFRTMRAIWSPDVGTDYLMPAKFKERPFRTSLNRRDRHEIVQLTSNYNIATKPEPIDVNQFMLTSLGAWADMVGAWDPKGEDSLDVEQWIQRGTQGRDHFVRVCYKGFLFPFGHRATLVKETERKFRRTPRGDMAAYLMQRLYIILRQPVREYPASGLQGMLYQGRNIPFRRITITTKSTPNLKLPVALPGMSSNSFWPIFIHDGLDQDVKWSCIGRDWDNNDVQFSVPLAFIANTDATGGNCENWITNNYKNETARRTINMNGQSIAYAPSAKTGDTSLPTTTFLLHGYYSSGVVPNTPRFFPSMQKSSVSIDKVNELLGTNSPREIEYFLSYLKYAFEKGTPPANGAGSVNFDQVKNTAQVFVNLLSQLEMNFSSQTDKAGGLAAPTISIGALSRLMGPIPGDFTIPGNLADEAAKIAAMANKLKDAVVAAGNFDPMQYFKDLLGAKILGDITLQDVLNFVQDVLSNLDKMPGLDKKDDFGVKDQIKEGLSKSELAAALTEKANEIEEVKKAAEKLVGSVNAEVQAAKNEVQNIVNQVKNEIDQVKNDVMAEVNGAKRAVEAKIKEWKKKVEDAANELKSEIEKAIKPLKEAGNEAYKMYEQANEALSLLKQGLNLVFEWQTEIKSTPGDILVPMYPGTMDKYKKAILYLKAEIKKSLDLKPPEVLLFGSVSNFVVNLIGTGAAQFLIIKFNRVAISVKIGEKPSIDPDIEAVEFAGPLTFVNKLKDLIPSGGSGGGVGFSFGFDVQPSGVTATLTITLPNVTVGVFSLQNMSFLMRLTVPFDGRPFTAYFAFCSKENPFRITIMMFGGGGFFGIEISPKGVRMLEAAFEFGGNFAFDCGVASGGASVMAGIYYKLEIKEIDGKDVEQSQLTGYFRLTGNLSVLGLIRVSLLFELKLTWMGNGKVYGTATIEVTIEILFLSFSVGVTVERQLKGEDADPTFADQLPQHNMWEEYCNAFA